MQQSLAKSVLAAALICIGCETSPHYHQAASCQPGCNACSTQSGCQPGLVQHWDFIPTDDDAEDFAEDAAHRRLHQLRRCSHERLTLDYREGFVQAYEDIAKGGNGVVPAVPPKRYWKSRYRSPQGRMDAYQWFAGYESGANMAFADGVAEYRAIPSSFDYEYACGYQICPAGCQSAPAYASPEQLTPIPEPFSQHQAPVEAAPPPAPAPADEPVTAPKPSAEPKQPAGEDRSAHRQEQLRLPAPPAEFEEVDAGLIERHDAANLPFYGAGHTDF